MVKKRADKWCIQIFDRQDRRFFIQTLFRKIEQQAERVTVTGNGVRARLALSHKTICKK
jgi:hypothetical protein